MATVQQYYDFILTADEKAEAIRRLQQLLPDSESLECVPGTPFNASWWGWEDDPIPARPGERDFKAGFMHWLADGGYDETEIADIVTRCPQSDGPTRRERIEQAVMERPSKPN